VRKKAPQPPETEWLESRCSITEVVRCNQNLHMPLLVPRQKTPPRHVPACQQASGGSGNVATTGKVQRGKTSTYKRKEAPGSMRGVRRTQAVRQAVRAANMPKWQRCETT